MNQTTLIFMGSLAGVLIAIIFIGLVKIIFSIAEFFIHKIFGNKWEERPSVYPRMYYKKEENEVENEKNT